MTFTRGCSFVLAAALAALAGDEAGLKPRADVADYPVHASREGLDVGARLLPPEEVRGGFATDLTRGYLVIEVAVYPRDDRKIDLGPGDFVLRVPGSDWMARPAGPRAIAAALQRSAAGDREITLYPQVGVGYESGSRRGGGLNTSVGVGAGVGRSRTASTEQDRKTMELELGEKQLPEKVTSAPVAGYLYFPATARRKTNVYQLEYDSPAGKMTLDLPQP